MTDFHTYVLIDPAEKRIANQGTLSRQPRVSGQGIYFVAALAENPETITEFNQAYDQLAGFKNPGQPRVHRPFYLDSNFPSVPEDVTIDEIRMVLGLKNKPEEEVLELWKKASYYCEDNYISFKPDEKTPLDIRFEPVTDWSELAKISPTMFSACYYSIVDDCRRSLLTGIRADLRDKSIKYVKGTIEIPRSGGLIKRPFALYSHTSNRDLKHEYEPEYSFSEDWTIEGI